MPPVYKSYRFWVLVAGLLAFIAANYAPSFPFTSEQILQAIVFILGLLGIVPELKSRNLM